MKKFYFGGEKNRPGVGSDLNILAGIRFEVGMPNNRELFSVKQVRKNRISSNHCNPTNSVYGQYKQYSKNKTITFHA